jgi:FHA domain-containing protein/type VI secretion system protein
MPLVLKVLSHRGAPPATPIERRFDVSGGTIGRLPENDLVLEDPERFVSRQHARIEYGDGNYLLHDVGGNDSLLNGNALGGTRIARLSEGDRIEIGDYVIEVRVLAEPTAEMPGEAQAPAQTIVPTPGIRAPRLSKNALDDLLGFESSESATAWGALPLDPLGVNPGAGTNSGSNTPTFSFEGPRPAVRRVVAQPAIPPADQLPDPLSGAAPPRADEAYSGSIPDNVAPQSLPLPGELRAPRPLSPAPAPAGIVRAGPSTLRSLYGTGTSGEIAPARPAPSGLIPDDYDPLDDALLAAPAPVAAPDPPPAPPPASMPARAIPTPGLARPKPPATAAMRGGAEAAPDPGTATTGWSTPTPRAATVAAKPPAGGDATLEALRRGLGLPDLPAFAADGTPNAELAGRMLRLALGGIMQVLAARAATKNTMRTERTLLGVRDNNPLKFLPDVDTALAQLFDSRGTSYLPALKAIGASIDDVRAHEQAMLGAMRATLLDVLKRLDPEQIERGLDGPTVIDKVSSGRRKAKMWDSLVEAHHALAREVQSDFQRLLAEHFEKAAGESTDGRRSR